MVLAQAGDVFCTGAQQEDEKRWLPRFSIPKSITVALPPALILLILEPIQWWIFTMIKMPTTKREVLKKHYALECETGIREQS